MTTSPLPRVRKNGLRNPRLLARNPTRQTNPAVGLHHRCRFLLQARPAKPAIDLSNPAFRTCVSRRNQPARALPLVKKKSHLSPSRSRSRSPRPQRRTKNTEQRSDEALLRTLSDGCKMVQDLCSTSGFRDNSALLSDSINCSGRIVDALLNVAAVWLDNSWMRNPYTRFPPLDSPSCPKSMTTPRNSKYPLFC